MVCVSEDKQKLLLTQEDAHRNQGISRISVVLKVCKMLGHLMRKHNKQDHILRSLC
jgi:hypothetical protein